MEKENIIETGIVKSQNENIVVITRENPDACRSCKVKATCNTKHEIDIFLETPEKYEVGEIVELIIPPNTRIFSSFIIYIAPLIILIISYIISIEIFKFNDSISIFISFLSLIISFFLIKLVNLKVKKNNDIKIIRK
ncbi:MAG: SoxR reducing system RseC family protein [Candidatus Cloacimonetes bacterium]|nr:SoxR reducing system RseC family protein [Candidatus Cloacimonadota bacterium]